MGDLLAGLEAHLLRKGCSKDDIAKTENGGLDVSHKKGLISLRPMPLGKGEKAGVRESYAVILCFKSLKSKDYEDMRRQIFAHAAALKKLTGSDLFTATIHSEADFDRIDFMFDVIKKYDTLYEKAYKAPVEPSIPNSSYPY